MTKNEKAIICSQCGSNDIDLVAEDYAVCRNCGSKIIFKKETPATVVKNEVHVYTAPDTENQVNTGNYVMKAAYGSDDFIRSVYVDLAKDRKTPPDIFNSEFQPVRKEYRQLVAVSATVDLTYTASIGYDRKEEYLAQEKYYDSTFKEYRYRNVVKTRTVTDWHPTSGQFSGEATELADNSGKNECSAADCKRFREEYTAALDEDVYEIDKVDFETDYPADPDENSVETATENCIDTVRYDCRYSLQGDHVKDFNATAKTEITEIDCYVAPEYVVEYNYKYEKAEKRGFAFGNMQLYGNNIDSSRETNAEIDKKCFPYLLAALIAMLASCVISLALRNPVLSIIFFVLAAAVFVFNEIYFNKVGKNIKGAKQQEKIKALEKLLSEQNLSPLTPDEKSMLS